MFLEPEGLDSHMVYPNGISTSLPVDVQQTVVRTMPGVRGGSKSCSRAMRSNMNHIDPRAAGRPNLQGFGRFPAFIVGRPDKRYDRLRGRLPHKVWLPDWRRLHRPLGKAAPTLDRANAYIAVMLDDSDLAGCDRTPIGC